MFWIYGKVDFGGHQGDPYVPPYTPTGDILALNDTDVFGYAGAAKGAKVKNAVFSIPANPQAIGDPRGATARERDRKDRKREKKAGTTEDTESPAAAMRLKYNWMQACPTEVAAIALAGKVLFVAGATEDGNPKLLAYAIEDGRLLSELPLPAPPVFDGMAVARARLYLTLKDGSVLCLEPAAGRQ